MRHETNPIDAATAFVSNPTGGIPIVVERFREKTVQVAGTFTAVCNLQGSLDGSNWVNLYTGLTTATLYTIAQAVRLLRIAITTDGTRPTVTFGGFDSRTDGG